VRREQALQAARVQCFFGVDRDQNVAFPNARAGRGPARRDSGGDQALRRLPPERAVVHQREARFKDEVGDAQGRESQADTDHQHVLEAAGPHVVRGPPATKRPRFNVKQSTCLDALCLGPLNSFRNKVFFAMPSS
jgi:hypothetical protein